MATAAQHQTAAETLIEQAAADLANGRVEAANVNSRLAVAEATLATVTE